MILCYSPFSLSSSAKAEDPSGLKADGFPLEFTPARNSDRWIPACARMTEGLCHSTDRRGRE